MRKVIMLCIVLFTLPLVSAYYADVLVDVSPEGDVSITGTTNHPALLVDSVPDFTFKDGSHWLLNMSVSGVFEEGLVTIILPSGTDINYLKAPSFSRFTQYQGRPAIVSTLENQQFSFLVQYTLGNVDRSSSLFLVVLAIIFLLIGFGFWQKFRKKSFDFPFDIFILPARQRAILEFILKQKGRTTQAQLEKVMELPKSSLSRNIDALVRQGFIEKIPTGMTNVLQLKKLK
ncbi:MarR family transcriptional regulator [Candidatus Woesearchaeota archaeon]|nr:MarR family transcriptional regulator [Candidatus Woesearchaeota archaeon]